MTAVTPAATSPFGADPRAAASERATHFLMASARALLADGVAAPDTLNALASVLVEIGLSIWTAEQVAHALERTAAAVPRVAELRAAQKAELHRA